MYLVSIQRGGRHWFMQAEPTTLRNAELLFLQAKDAVRGYKRFGGQRGTVRILKIVEETNL